MSFRQAFPDKVGKKGMHPPSFNTEVEGMRLPTVGKNMETIAYRMRSETLQWKVLKVVIPSGCLADFKRTQFGLSQTEVEREKSKSTMMIVIFSRFFLLNYCFCFVFMFL